MKKNALIQTNCIAVTINIPQNTDIMEYTPSDNNLIN